MIPRMRLWPGLLLACAALAPAALAEQAKGGGQKALCPRVRLVGPNIGLNEAEKKLLCGNEDSEGWKVVPLNQAEYFLRAFLQRRGFHYPRFQAEGETLTVFIGTRTLVSKLTGDGLEGLIDLGKKRNVVGRALTPAELDTLKADLSTRLQELGYACPTVTIDADARTGEVHASVARGVLHVLTYIHPPLLENLDPDALNRFQAHQYGTPFDIRTLNLTSARIVQEALYQSAYYEVACTTAGLRVTQRIVEAKPRLITVGFGIDTDGYARGRARWRHSRIGYRASSAQATLFASFREQKFDALMHYYLRPADRLNLIPSFMAKRTNEPQFEIAESQVSLSPAWTWDDSTLHLEVQGGPAVEYFNTLKGQGPSEDRFLAFKTQLNVTSHLFEYYQRDPRQGWQAGFESSSRVKGAYSNLSAQRLRLFGQKLWNLGNFDPPWLVLASRGWAGTLAVPDRAAALARLPPTQRFFIGGDADVRGAQRLELPNDGSGFLTAVYHGVELRVADLLPFRIQPLLFGDVAMGGRRQFHLDNTIYYSPGVGARWASPVGAFRFTAARGLVARASDANPTKLPHWQFFVSFGTEF